MSGKALVILAHPADSAAAVLAAEVGRRGRVRTRTVTDLELAAATFRHHPATRPGRLGARPGDGVWLVDGTLLSPATVGCLYSRLVHIPSPAFGRAEDRQYAAAELHALMVSWLTGLGRIVVNAASPLGLGGATRDLVTTLDLARRAGLPVPRTRIVTDDARTRFPRNGRWQRFPLPQGGLPASLDELGAGELGAGEVGAGELGAGELGAGAGPPVGLPALLVEPLAPTRTRVLVAGDVVVGASPELAPACRMLARATGNEVYEAVLAPAQRSGRLVCLGGRPVPILHEPNHVTALAAHLEDRVVLGSGAAA